MDTNVTKVLTYTADDHTFALCAYKESDYLENCIQSLLAQTVKTNIIITTSTPNEHISELASRYGLPLYTNEEPPGIARDWNFAISCVDTPLATIAHQDDIYAERYAEVLLNEINRVDHPLIFFTDYGEIRAEGIVTDSKLLNTKRLLLSPLKKIRLQNSRFIRRRILSLGSAICCPSVTLVIPHIPLPLFEDRLKCDLDWSAWERLSKNKGAFIYASNILMYHRIHEDSETTALIEDNTRSAEDLEMLETFWPKPIARLVHSLYVSSQKSNEMS